MKISGFIAVCMSLLFTGTSTAQELHVTIPSPGQNLSTVSRKSNNLDGMPVIPSPQKRRYKRTKSKKKSGRIYKKKFPFQLVTRDFARYLDSFDKDSSSKISGNKNQLLKSSFRKSKTYAFRDECKLHYQHGLQNKKLPYVIFRPQCIAKKQIRLNRAEHPLLEIIAASRRDFLVLADLKLNDIQFAKAGMYWSWAVKNIRFANSFYDEIYKFRVKKSWDEFKKPPQSAELFRILVRRFRQDVKKQSPEGKRMLVDDFHKAVKPRSIIHFDANNPVRFLSMHQDQSSDSVEVNVKFPKFLGNDSFARVNAVLGSRSLHELSRLKKGQEFEAELEFYKIIEVSDKFYIHWNTILIKNSAFNKKNIVELRK